jgi:flagellar basal-body rod protein FlgG
MIVQLQMAKSATYAFEREMQVIADNVANANTLGHKEQSVHMENLFPMVFERTLSEFEDANVPPGKERRTYNEQGQGVRISEIVRNMAQGTIEITNRSLDFAIQGRGMFQFRTPDGQIVYGRAGNFHQDANGNVLNAAGYPLEPTIQVPRDANDIIVNEEGRVFAQVSGETIPREIGQMSLATFQNEEGLVSIGQNMYRDTVSSGDPVISQAGEQNAGTVRQRSLEFSNVNIVQQLMQMIITQRAFETAVKAIKATDAILKTGGDIK